LPLAWARAEHAMLFPVRDFTPGRTNPAGGGGLVCGKVWSCSKVDGLRGVWLVPWSRLDLEDETRNSISQEIAKDPAYAEFLFLVELEPVENPSVSLRGRMVSERSLSCAVLAAALAAERGMDLKLAVATADVSHKGPNDFGLK